MSETNSKIRSIVLLRGIAALCVCFVHFQLLTNMHVNRVVDFLVNNGQQGVAIFFVISGFILPYSLYKKGYHLKSFFGFLLKRSARIDPPYWASIVLLFVIGGVPYSLLSFKLILLHLFYLVPFVPGNDWYSGIFFTLSIEFQFYLLLGLFYPFLMKIKSRYSILLLIAISVICVTSALTPRGIIITNLYDFAVGFIVFLIYIKTIAKVEGCIYLGIFIVYIMCFVSITSGFVPLISALFILLHKGNYKYAALYFIGEISYSLYLIHIPVSTFFIDKVHTFISNPIILFGGSLIVSILAAYVFNMFIERPSIKLSRLIKLK